jgi:LytS/YehU family sensor histidine kinase
MNPHFIFNALNSVNQYIHQNDERAANRFLSDFSKLMRMVLDYSQLDFITMEEERNLLKLYLKLEHIRFKDRFDYEINEPDNIDFSAIEIPPMLIQPFVENAVWHGLRYKNEKGFLSVTFTQANNALQIDIKDNGIGREKSKALKTQNQQKYKSTGLRNVSKRIDLVNKVYQKKYDLEIKDLKPGQDEPGTLVRIQIPF